MMYCFWFLLLSVINFALCQDCVIENFEYNYESDFNNNYGSCSGYLRWSIKQYSSLQYSIKSPHLGSTRFVTVQSPLRCISSFNFTMTGGGTIEVNRYMTTRHYENEMSVLVFRIADAGTVEIVAEHHSFMIDFVPGWQTLTLSIPGLSSFTGY
ncbi:jg1500, partial [Pararge aegeria aegeria]